MSYCSPLKFAWCHWRHLCVLLFVVVVAFASSAAAAGSVFHHGSFHRQIVSEGSQVSLQCRIPAHTMGRLVMDRSPASAAADSSPPSGPTVVWLRTDRKDPSSQEVISHGDTLLVESNPRLRLSYQQDTGASMLIIDRAQVQDGGVFQCQMVIEEEVVPSVPIEVIIEERKKKHSSSGADLSRAAFVAIVLSTFIATIVTH